MARNKQLATRSGSKASMRQMVKSILDNAQEHKAGTFGVNGSNWTTGGTTFEITRFITQGDNIFNRSGDQITVKSLKVHLDTTSTVATQSTGFRIICFADNMANGLVPGTTDLLDIADYRSSFNTFNMQRKRFKVLYDRSFTNVFGTQTQQREIVINLPKLHHKVYYNGSASTTADNGKGAIFIMAIANAAGNGGWSFLPQVTYTDS